MSQRPFVIKWGNSNTQEPSDPKKATGWNIQEKPPRNYFNWKWNLDSSTQFYMLGQSQEFIVISSDTDEQDYATLAAYIADAPAAGDKVLVKETQVLTAQMIIPDDITLRILDGVLFTRSTLDAVSVIKLGSNIIIEGVLNLVLSQTGTTAKAIEIDGDNNFGDILVENSSTGTLTDAFAINAGKVNNSIRGIAKNSGGGTLNNVLIDNSIAYSNNVIIANNATGEFVRSNGAKAFRDGLEFDLGSDADGDIYYRDAGVLKRLAKGTNGQVLELAAGIPSWQDTAENKNLVINGIGIVPQRADYTLIKDAYDFGKCDRFEGMATGTLVTAGTLTQDAAANIGITGFAHKFSAVTLTGTGIIYHRTRIESADAKALKNQLASLACKVYHDVGAPVTYTLFVRKANAQDDFSAVTAISDDGGTAVSDTTATELKFENISMGDCSNGIEIELKIECGAITTKNFEITDVKLEKGASATAFVNRSIEEEAALCQRYFEKSYDEAVDPGTNTANGGIHENAVRVAASSGFGTRFAVAKRSTPAVTLFSTPGTSGNVTNNGDKVASAVNVGTSGFSRITITSGTTAFDLAYNWIADSEL